MKRAFAAGFPLLGVCLVLWIIPAPAATTRKGSFVIKEVKHMESRPLRDVATIIPRTDHFVERKEHVFPRIPSRVIAGPDPVLQNDDEISNDLAVTVGLNFDGMNGSEAGGVIPPDTNGAAGDKQFVLITNLAYSVYDKATGKQTLGPTKIHNIWGTVFGGQCGTEDGGDPVVLYDRIANRWFVSQVEYFSSFQLCMAVSQTDDATGKYNLYAFTINGGLPDYPKYGVWPDAYYLSFNFYGPGWALPCAVDRTAMLANQAATMVCIQAGWNFGLMPSDFDGSTLPPSGAPNHYVELGLSNVTLQEYDFHVDFPHPEKSTFKGPNNLTIPAYKALCAGGKGACIPQPAGTLLDAMGAQMMFRNAYRNFGDHEALVFSHTVAAGGASKAVSAERWYELRSTPPGSSFTLYQAGTYQNKINNYWMGSIAMDQAGDIALGFSADNSKKLDPSIYFTGRVPGDPLNKMEGAMLAVKGSAVQCCSNRWGDYSSMSVDPVDDCTFWYTQEYDNINNGKASDNWQSHVVSFKFNSCQ